MKLDWSKQSPHILTLFRPWQPGDGYDEATLQAAEARLGVRLPAALRNFYQAWGKRPDLTRAHHVLLNPDELLIRADILIFSVQSQHVGFWGIRHEALEEADPPVLAVPSGYSRWEPASDLDWTTSHPHLSNFLDDLTYLHAFSGGAIHGGWTQPALSNPPAHERAWFEATWSKAAVTALVFGLEPDPTIENWATLYGPTLYVRDGVAFWWSDGCGLACRKPAVVDELAQRFQITWARQW